MYSWKTIFYLASVLVYYYKFLRFHRILECQDTQTLSLEGPVS